LVPATKLSMWWPNNTYSSLAHRSYIKEFHPKEGTWEGAEQMLKSACRICPVTNIFCCFFHRVDAKLPVFRDYTDKKKIKFSSYTYKEIHSGAVAKSYLRKGFEIYEEMRNYFTIYALIIYDFATGFPYIYGKFDFRFYRCTVPFFLYTIVQNISFWAGAQTPWHY
jgi:hypothetical protein